jgi:hypothetical protein
MPVISALAAASVTPGRSRPMAKMNSPRRVSYQLLEGSGEIWRFIAIGTQRSTCVPRSAPAKPRAATPTTV